MIEFHKIVTSEDEQVIWPSMVAVVRAFFPGAEIIDQTNGVTTFKEPGGWTFLIEMGTFKELAYQIKGIILVIERENAI